MKNFTEKFLPREKVMQILSALREKCFVFVTIIIYYYIYDYYNNNNNNYVYSW